MFFHLIFKRNCIELYTWYNVALNKEAGISWHLISKHNSRLPYSWFLPLDAPRSKLPVWVKMIFSVNLPFMLKKKKISNDFPFLVELKPNFSAYPSTSFTFRPQLSFEAMSTSVLLWDVYTLTCWVRQPRDLFSSPDSEKFCLYGLWELALPRKRICLFSSLEPIRSWKITSSISSLKSFLIVLR